MQMLHVVRRLSNRPAEMHGMAFVDPGSSDGNIEFARSLGMEVLDERERRWAVRWVAARGGLTSSTGVSMPAKMDAYGMTSQFQMPPETAWPRRRSRARKGSAEAS